MTEIRNLLRAMFNELHRMNKNGDTDTLGLIESLKKGKQGKHRTENPKGLWRCPKCEHENPNTTFVCKNCGYSLT